MMKRLIALLLCILLCLTMAASPGDMDILREYIPDIELW